MRRGLALAASMLGGCWTASPSPPVSEAPAAAHPASPLQLHLVATPVALTMATRDEFRIGFRATNTIDHVVDPKLHLSTLLVDDKPSMQWSASVGNGAIEDEWSALPPGHTLTREWQIGEQLFPAPGDYVLVLQLPPVSTPPVRVHVAP